MGRWREADSCLKKLGDVTSGGPGRASSAGKQEPGPLHLPIPPHPLLLTSRSAPRHRPPPSAAAAATAGSPGGAARSDSHACLRRLRVRTRERRARSGRRNRARGRPACAPRAPGKTSRPLGAPLPRHLARLPPRPPLLLPRVHTRHVGRPQGRRHSDPWGRSPPSPGASSRPCRVGAAGDCGEASESSTRVGRGPGRAVGAGSGSVRGRGGCLEEAAGAGLVLVHAVALRVHGCQLVSAHAARAPQCAR
jgi:hypothetical protein